MFNWIKYYSINFLIFLIYGMIGAAVLYFVYDMIILYSFMIPGAVFLFYGIVRFFTETPAPRVPACAPATNPSQGQVNLLSMDGNIEAARLEMGLKKNGQSIVRGRSLLQILLRRNGIEGLLYGVLFMTFAYWSYFV